MNVWNIKTMSVRLERRIEAPPDQVFDAWLDPACEASPWHGAKPGWLQAEVDGLFYRKHLSKAGDMELAHYGRFTEVTRPARLQYTWISQHTRGLESLVTLDFLPRGTATQIVLVHENLPDDEKGRMHDGGWHFYLGLLEQAMAHHAAKA